MAGVMIEDQIAPKRCGHTKGKSVVGREEAYSRVRAACDARYCPVPYGVVLNVVVLYCASRKTEPFLLLPKKER